MSQRPKQQQQTLNNNNNNNSAAVGASAPAASLQQQPTSVGAADALTDARQFTKRFTVLITGTMNNFSAEGPTAASWFPMREKNVAIFADSIAESQHDMGNAVKILQNAWLVGARLLEAKNTFPVPLGAKVSCIPGQEHTEMGEKFAFTCLPLSHNSTPLTLFEADASRQSSIDWRRKYGEYNKTNIETHNVLDVSNQPYVFVHASHPAISLLRANADLLIGSELTADQMIDGEWYKVSRSAHQTCCNTLRSKVLSKMKVDNLNELSLQAKGLDARDWTDESDLLAEHTLAGENVFDKPYSLMARIELTYELHAPVSPPPPLPSAAAATAAQ